MRKPLVLAAILASVSATAACGSSTPEEQVALPDPSASGLALSAQDSVIPGSQMPGSQIPDPVGSSSSEFQPGSPGSVAPGSVIPGSVVPGSVIPGSVVPGSVVPGPEAVNRPAAPGMRPDRESAAAFARYYFTTVDHAFRTGDVVPLRATSTSFNQTTADYVGRATQWYAEGYRALGLTQHVTTIRTRQLPTRAGGATTVEVQLRYSAPAVTVRNSAGSTFAVPAVPARTVVVTTLWVNTRWLAAEVSSPR